MDPFPAPRIELIVYLPCNQPEVTSHLEFLKRTSTNHQIPDANHGAGICTPTFVPFLRGTGTNVGVHIPAPWSIWEWRITDFGPISIWTRPIHLTAVRECLFLQLCVRDGHPLIVQPNNQRLQIEAANPICEPWCWYIFLQNWVIFRVNVGKYSIHGAYGFEWW